MSAAWECCWFFISQGKPPPNLLLFYCLCSLAHWLIGCPAWRLLVAVKIQLIEQFTLLRLAMVSLLPG